MNERLKALRKDLRLTQSDFGDKLGVTGTAIARIEKGERSLTEQMLLAVCRTYNVNEEWLRTGAGDMFKRDPATEIDALAQKYNLTDFDKAIVSSYAQLTAEQRKAVNDFVGSLYKASSETAAELAPPVSAQRELTIDEKVDQYRARLEAEEKGIA